MGIEPTALAWEARVLPLYDARSVKPANSFSSRLIAWQQQHGRHDLPWQQTRDAYRIWLSEIMLQQTQVGTATPYYLRFPGTLSGYRHTGRCGAG
jgi:hypothetical protein